MASWENLKRATLKELPDQVIGYEIFTRLPVKSLLRCKSVCKSWLSMLSDPKFAKDHYHSCAMQNPNDYDCLIAQKYTAGLVILSRREETCILPPDRYLLIGSIYGLVCLRHDNKLWLWNPAIYQLKEFMFPPGMHRLSCYYWGGFGFGFDPATNDYKVAVCDTLSDKMCYAFVYSSNSDTWSQIIVPDYVLPTNRELVSFGSTTTIVKDCPYWTLFSVRLSNKFVGIITLKFDTGSNEFKLLPEFKLLDEFQSKRVKNILLVNMMDRPTLMEYGQDLRNITVDVYSLDEGNVVWSKMYTVGPVVNSCGNKNLLQGFKYGGEIVFDEHGSVSYYDHKTDTVRPIPSHLPNGISFFIPSCFRYTPSLVSLQGMKSDSDTHLVINQFVKRMTG